MLILKNCNIFNVCEGIFIQGNILIENGKILDVTKDDSIVGERIIDLKGNMVFPGFIDSHTHMGTWVLSHNGNDANECVNPAMPGLRIIDSLDPFDPSFKKALSRGYTASMITPGSGNVIGGICAVIKNKGSIKDMIVKYPAALKIAFGENPKRVYTPMKKSPSSRMSTAAIVRDFLSRAREKFNKNDGIKDCDMEVANLLFKGEIPLKIHAHRADDIMTAVRIAEEFGLKYTIDHCTEGHLILDFLKNKDIHILAGPLGLYKSKAELKNASFKNPKILSDAGFKVSIISDHPFLNCDYLNWYIGIAVREGLDFAEAVRGVTIYAAEAIGVDKVMGSIEKGKDADIAVFDGNPFETGNHTIMTLIKGDIAYINEGAGDKYDII